MLFEFSRLQYLLYRSIHNLRLKLFPPTNIYTLNSEFMAHLPTHCEPIYVKDLTIVNIDGHCIAIWDKSEWRGIIEITWAKSPMELYSELNYLQKIY
jgi:hypothetical protein